MLLTGVAWVPWVCALLTWAFSEWVLWVLCGCLWLRVDRAAVAVVVGAVVVGALGGLAVSVDAFGMSAEQC